MSAGMSLLVKTFKGPRLTRRRFRVSEFGIRAWGLGFRVEGLGFRAWGLGFRLRFGVRSLAIPKAQILPPQSPKL